MNPSDEIKSLADKIEASHLKLLSMDQQYFRVQKLHKSEIEAIAALQNIKADLEKHVESRTADKTRIEAEIDALFAEKQSLAEDNKSARAIFIQTNKEIEEAKAGHDAKESALKESEFLMNARNEAATERDKNTALMQDGLRKKLDAINSLKEKI